MKIFLKYTLTIAMAIISLTTRAASGPLNPKQQSIVSISAFTATGRIAQLSTAIHQGLDSGLTIAEVKEIMVHLYAYAGFPRSLNALHALMNVLAERKSKGIIDTLGKEASPYPSNKTSREFGTENQEKLVGKPVKGPVYEFAPAIDQFLKEHLFGDIFGRDVLDYQTREIVTVTALASMKGTENQLRSHITIGMYNGLTKEQMIQLVAIVNEKVGATEGKNANQVLQAIINPTKPIETSPNNSENESFEGAFKKGNRTENNNFSGTVWVNYIVPADSIFNMSMATVTFEPSVRTNWHKHASGQILVITDGIAYYQERGKPKQILIKGQIVKCPPNIIHWHGASPNGTMTHLASNSNLNLGHVIWLEKVSDQEYNKE